MRDSWNRDFRMIHPCFIQSMLREGKAGAHYQRPCPKGGSSSV
ncbi:MAG: hypothetical protein JETT_1753 [Candidatus Jettenia ecosi]|uniref:Uncharacterized protein n=1 Tax=Candidatus Jettenia ecosi TaxID=2494326 RepID=A0A533QB86_9BACT|nr:MAG: hypothetical protein JETT_1753 [Candidatus Jettenia ecosi]